ncbi:hypothetical protein [Nocardia sp. NPDC059195]|uniref:hypothetical protein n=1 Tax=Nocardia sp. NPDC059195 TaxID=3346765 RepID=UPI0036985AD8
MAQDGRPELIQQIHGQEHLAWASQQARDYVIQHNDWRPSIRHQGVMTEVWLAATTFEDASGNPSVTVPVTAEGSSRMTCVHDLLGVRSADVPYERDERRMRAEIRKLNDEIIAAGSPDQVESEAAIRARCEKVPALLLVGFESHGDIASDFGVAVKSLVALRHVDPPEPWGEATENEALADAVLDELKRRNLITAGKADWLAGALTPVEAEVAGFTADSSVRTAAIFRLFTDRSPHIHEAVRAAVTTQSTRKKTSWKLASDLATSLILRSVSEDDSRKRERIRKYLKVSFDAELDQGPWEATFRSGEELTTAALVEVELGNPGPATRELGARAAYPLVVNQQLLDRGPRDIEPEDRRNPGAVVNRMRVATAGVHQLGQALTDHNLGRQIRLVDDAGQIQRTAEGRDIIVKNAGLRHRFQAPGEGPGLVTAPQTPAEILGNALTALGGAIRDVEIAVRKVEAVRAHDGMPAIDALGATKVDCDAWQNILFGTLQKLPIWSSRNAQRHGLAAGDDADLEDEDLEEDDYLDDLVEVQDIEAAG